MDIIRLTEPNTPLNDADHVGSFNFKEKCQMGDMKQHQPPLTIGEQIENLKSIGLVIKDYWKLKIEHKAFFGESAFLLYNIRL